MADKKFSELPEGSAPVGTEIVPMVQGGATVRRTVADFSPASLGALETKIGATLVEDGDARMTDARTPTAHDLDSHLTCTTAEFLALLTDTVLARLDVAQVYTAGQHPDVETLAYGATVAVDADGENAKKLTLTGAAEVSNPTNCLEGKSWTLRVIQDGTGGRALTFAANYEFPAGTPDTSADTSAQERLFTFYAVSATRIIGIDAIGAAY
jgi:hypothetical protein